MFSPGFLVLLSAQAVLCFGWEGDLGYGILHLNTLNGSTQDLLYDYREAAFGLSLAHDSVNYYKGVLLNTSPRHGCSTIRSPPHRPIPMDCVWVAIIERSQKGFTDSCNFAAKVFNAQQAGFGAVIIYNNNPAESGLIQMGYSNDSLADQIKTPSVFVTYDTGNKLKELVYREKTTWLDLWTVTFIPDPETDPYRILLTLAFAFIAVLLITCIVVSVRWCRAIRRRQHSRISKKQLKKIPLAKYKLGDKYDCCTICLDDYVEGDKLRLLPCEHTYHQKCIDPWLLKNKRTCPVCKRKVIPRPRGAPETDSDDSENERAPLLDEAAGGQEPTVSNAPRTSYGTSNETEQPGPSVRPPRTRIRILRPRLSLSLRNNRNEETRRPLMLIESSSSSSEDEENDLRTNRSLIDPPTAQTPTDVQNHSLHSIPNLSNYRPADAANSSSESDSSDSNRLVTDHEVTCEVEIEKGNAHNEIV